MVKVSLLFSANGDFGLARVMPFKRPFLTFDPGISS
jgi:hypothetical protein